MKEIKKLKKEKWRLKMKRRMMRIMNLMKKTSKRYGEERFALLR